MSVLIWLITRFALIFEQSEPSSIVTICATMCVLIRCDLYRILPTESDLTNYYNPNSFLSLDAN